jgi:hypothetical protein
MWLVMGQSGEMVDVEEEADAAQLDKARLASLLDADAQRAAEKPLIEWKDAELKKRFAASQMLPLVRS